MKKKISKNNFRMNNLKATVNYFLLYLTPSITYPFKYLYFLRHFVVAF